MELLHSATSTVEFSFDNTIYRQIDGVAMGSPLDLALANIFVGYYEEKLFSEISKPAVYFRYVDDTFVIYQNEKESKESPDLAFLFPLRRDYPLKSASRKAFGTAAFFKATQKELLGQQLFSMLSKSNDRVFLKPNAKTAFFKAILKNNLPNKLGRVYFAQCC